MSDLFADLPAPIRAALARRGFESLTAVQQAVVNARSEGRDLRISSQTGSGKTVAIGLALADHFLPRQEPKSESAADAVAVNTDGSTDGSTDGTTGGNVRDAKPARPPKAKRGPAIPRGPRGASPTALVIVPTRELAAQVREELSWLYAGIKGLGVEVVTGGTSIGLERRALARGPALVVGTPGRLLDHMRNAAIRCDEIEHVVLDEADQMLDMGFREELEAIVEQLPKERSSHLVSATFSRAVRDLANRFQNDALTIEGTRLGEANADIQHIAYAIKRHETYAALVNVLLLAGDERCLLFVNRRVDATDLAEKLAKAGFGAAPFSGELAQAQRTRTLNSFRNGTLPILVSTEVAARGIDVPGISTVIHVDPPREADAYTHRSGRTGRAGQAGRSILFVTPADMGRVRRMLQYAKIDISWQPVPTPEKVQKALRKQSRRALHEKLAAHEPEETQMMYAKSLIEERDPVQVIAALLELAAPEVKTQPMKVMGFDPTAEPRGRGRNDRRPEGRAGRAFDRGADRGPARGNGRGPARPGDHKRSWQQDNRPAAGPRGGNAGPGGHFPDPSSFTRFFVSWGEESGATTGRVLSQVCRRGGIDSHQVGPIEIASRVSFVSVANEVAGEFEKQARRPDKRDPGIVIKRAEEKGRPGHGARGANPRGPSIGGGGNRADRNGPPKGPRGDSRGPSGPRSENRGPRGDSGGPKGRFKSQGYGAGAGRKPGRNAGPKGSR